MGKVRLEDRVRDEDTRAPVTNTNATISEGSRADYSVHTIKENGAVVAVLMDVMDAKLTSHRKFRRALGQVCSNSLGWEGVSFLLPCSSLATA